jgi:PAS domain S-box-containing protein
MRGSIIRLILLLILAFTVQAGVCAPLKSIRVGVLAKETVRSQPNNWNETIDFLNRSMPNYKFSITSLNWSELKTSLQKGNIDFIISNPIFSLEMEINGLLTNLATFKRKNNQPEGFKSLYGSTIFWKKGRGITSVEQVKGKTIAAGAALSIGGWLAAEREFKENSIDLRTVCKKIIHCATPQIVINKVMSEEADFGITFTSILEELALADEINLERLEVSTEFFFDPDKLPFLCSTRLYPEWTFSRSSFTSPELAEKISLLLLKMEDDPKILTNGWAILANYSEVHQLMKILGLGPYRVDKSVFGILTSRFKRWIFSLVFALFAVAIFSFYLLGLNKKLYRVTEEVELQKTFLKHLIDSIPDIIFVKDSQGNFLIYNHAFAKAFGLDYEKCQNLKEQDLFGEKSPFKKGDQEIIKNGNPIKYEQEISLKDKPNIFGEIVKVAYASKESLQILGVVRDVTERHNSKAILLHREKLITGIAEAVHHIVGSERPIELTLPLALISVCRAIDADRVGLIQKEPGKKTFRCFSCHKKIGMECRISVADVVARIVDHAKEKIFSGRSLGPVKGDFPDEIYEELSNHGVKSLIVIPIFVAKKFWGCIEVQNFAEQKKWQDFELAALELAAEMFGSMIDRSISYKKLVDYKDRLQLAMESAQMSIWEYDYSLKKNFSPKELYKNLGYESEKTIEAAQKRGYDILHPDDRNFAQLAASQETWKFEARLENANKDYTWHIFIGRTYFDSENKPIRQIGFVRNTNEEHDRENQRKMEESRNSHALQAAKAASWEFIPESRQIFWSNHIEELLGYSSEEFSTTIDSIYQAIYPDDLHEVKQALRHFLITGNDLRFEARMLRKDGSYTWFANIGTQIFDSNFAARKYFGILIDISETKALESRLQEAKQKAEQMALVAQEANLAKSEFLANMSHEIRTPMNGVLGMVELLLSTNQNPRQREYTHLIHRSSHSLLNILNAILDLSKIEAGELTLDPSPTNINKIFEEVTGLMEPTAEKKGVQIVLKYDPDLPESAIVDGDRLRQVILNLVNNAVKFTEEGVIIAEVKIFQAAQSNRAYFNINIKDTGIGMNPDQQKKVFEKFKQADTSITRRFGGTGLGLTICRELVKMMGGTLQLESEEGVGTQIGFSLELELINEELPKVEKIPDDIKLIVSGNNQAVLDTIDEIVKSWQINCHTVRLKELKPCLKAILTDKPNLVVIIDAPQQKAALSAICREYTNAGIRCIMLVTYRQMDIAARIIKGSPHIYLMHKPLASALLHQAITTITKTSKPPTTSVDEFIAKQKHAEKKLEPLDIDLLVVEDNEINQEVARGMLEIIGCRFKIVGSGREALKEVRRGLYDAILLDCQMPIMDGFEVTKKIRLFKEPLSKIPIIAMTAHAMSGDREKCLNSGMDDYLTKPIESEDVREALLKVINSPDFGQIKIGEEATEKKLSVINADRLNRLFGKKPERMEKIVTAISDNVSKQLANIDKGLEEDNFKAIYAAAHTIKGSCANLGGERAAETALKLEHSAKQQDGKECLKIRLELEDKFSELKEELIRVYEYMVKNLEK